MIVSMISLMSRTIMNMARPPTLVDPNITKPFQRHVPAFSATLSSDLSSRRFIMDIRPSGMHCPWPYRMHERLYIGWRYYLHQSRHWIRTRESWTWLGEVCCKFVLFGCLFWLIFWTWVRRNKIDSSILVVIRCDIHWFIWPGNRLGQT